MKRFWDETMMPQWAKVDGKDAVDHWAIGDEDDRAAGVDVVVAAISSVVINVSSFRIASLRNAIIAHSPNGTQDQIGTNGVQ